MGTKRNFAGALGPPLAEIGQGLGVTESRVCQVRTKAVLQLRGKVQDVR